MAFPHNPTGCPMDAILRLLMGQWTTYILWVLRNNGPTRFNELKRKIPGISAKVLTERLRTLETSEIIYREIEPTNPPQVTYGLAQRGKALIGILDQLNEIAQQWYEAEAK
jgi:DNA-binding HxlR family transcriptional regulator